MRQIEHDGNGLELRQAIGSDDIGDVAQLRFQELQGPYAQDFVRHSEQPIINADGPTFDISDTPRGGFFGFTLLLRGLSRKEEMPSLDRKMLRNLVMAGISL